MNLKVWFWETRPRFLMLSVVLTFLGTAIAWYDGYFHLGHALLAGIGLVLANISINTLNDYFDYRSGIDLATMRTPFSGGSGILPTAQLQPKQVLWLGLGSFLLALPIGVFFVIVSGWALLPLLLVATACIFLYTSVLLKIDWPEWVPGVGMGTLPILGLYFIQTDAYTMPAVIASIPSGILVHNLLLLNEFPDVEADRQANRKTLPITIGKDKAAIFYAVVALAMYVWIIGWVVVRVMPIWTLLALLTLPFTIKAISGTRHHNDASRLMPALAANVMAVLLTPLFIGIGYILAYAL